MMLRPAVLALVVSAAGAAAHDGEVHAPAGDSAVFPAETLLAPDVPVTDRQGATGRFVERYAGAGPVLMSFTYASCVTVCPVANAVLAEMQDRVPGVTILTVSIDPARDTPEQMAASAEGFGAGPDWHWLVASPADTAALMAAFGVPQVTLDAHEPMFLIGDVGSGRFVRVVGLPDPDRLAAVVRENAGAP